MKALFPILLIAGVSPDASALAQSTTASPLLGGWTLDVPRLPEPPEQRPRSVTIAYSEIGGDKWRMNVVIVGGDGRTLDASGTYRVDGTPAPSKGYPGVDTIAARMPAPNVMVMALYEDRMPRTTRTYIVAPDGRTMTETVVDLNLNGEPGLRINHFNRVK